MAAVIIPPSPQGYDLSAGATPPAGQFAFEYATNQYVVAQQGGFGSTGGDLKTHLMKSVDGGATWNEVSPGSAPNTNDGAFTVGLDGALVVLIEADSSGNIQTWKIDLSSGTPAWTGPATHTITSFDTAASSGGIFLRLIIHGPGDYFVMYSGTKENVFGLKGRVYFVPFDGVATWGTETELPGQSGSAFSWGGITAVCDATARTYFFGQNTDTAGGFGRQLLVWVMASGGAPGSPQTVANWGYWNSEPGTFSEAIVYTPSGGPETVAIAGEFNDNITAATQGIYLYSAPTGVTPSWTGSAVTTGLVDSTNTLPSGAQYSTITGLPVPQDTPGWSRTIAVTDTGGTLQVTWCVTLLTAGIPYGYFYFSTSPDTALVWSAPASLFASPNLLPGTEGGESYQVFSYSMTAGLAVLGCTAAATDFSEAAQFFTSAAPTAIPSYAW